MRKRIITLFAVLLCVILAAVPGSGENSLPGNASENDLPEGWRLVYIPQVQISFAIPPDFDVITAETTESRFYSKEDIAEIMESYHKRGTYLFALSYDESRSIAIGVTKSLIPYGASLSKEEYDNIFVKKTTPFLEENGDKVLYHEVRQDGEMQYVFTRVKHKSDFPGMASYSVQFGTITDYNSIWVVLKHEFSETTQEDEEMLDQIRRYSLLHKRTWTCPNCGREATTKFCTECGTKRPIAVE